MSYKFEKPFPHIHVKLLWPFERITSYAHDQDHVHVHSHVILLHLENSKYIHPPTNKTPCCTMSNYLQSYHHNVWDIQKEIKDAYPKKVCHMPTRHVKKKERKRKYSPYKGERIHIKEFHPPSTKNIHTLALLDQGLWLVSPLDPVFDLAKYEKQVCHYILHTYRSTKKEPLEVGWKKPKAHKKALVRNETHLSDPRDHPRNLQNLFSKII